MIHDNNSKLLSAGGVRHGLPDPPAAGPLGHGDGVGGAARPPPLPHPRQSRALRQLQVTALSISYSLISFYCVWVLEDFGADSRKNKRSNFHAKQN